MRGSVGVRGYYARPRPGTVTQTLSPDDAFLVLPDNVSFTARFCSQEVSSKQAVHKPGARTRRSAGSSAPEASSSGVMANTAWLVAGQHPLYQHPSKHVVMCIEHHVQRYIAMKRCSSTRSHLILMECSADYDQGTRPGLDA